MAEGVVCFTDVDHGRRHTVSEHTEVHVEGERHMATQQTPEVFGEAIPVQRMSEMARRIYANVAGGRQITFAGFVWARPQAVASDLVVETVPAEQRKAA